MSYWRSRNVTKEAELSHQEELPKSDSKTQTDPDQPIDQDSFILLEEIMHKEKLYLKSDLTREDVLKRLHMDKNRFARMIQSNTEDNYTKLYRQPPHGTLHTANETISLLQPRSHRPRFRIGKRTCLTPPLQE